MNRITKTFGVREASNVAKRLGLRLSFCRFGCPRSADVGSIMDGTKAAEEQPQSKTLRAEAGLKSVSDAGLSCQARADRKLHLGVTEEHRDFKNARSDRFVFGGKKCVARLS